MLTFTQLQQLLAHVTKKEHAFYRSLYKLSDDAGVLQIQNFEEWRALPLVTKDALIDMPLGVRSFLPIGALDHVRASSGTSGKPPLFSPRTDVRNLDYRLTFHDFAKPFMSYTVPLMPYWHEQFQRMHGKEPHVVVYDPKNPAASIRIAKAAGIDALSLFIYHLEAAGEEMKRQGLNTDIRFLEITGETCPMSLYRYLRDTFPHATLLQSYGASEVEDVHIGIPCKPLDGTEPLSVYHPKSTHYLEILDRETGAILKPGPGVEGDLLITAYPGEPSAFPLLRFQIGDTIRVVEETCPHGEWSFTVVGRTDMDFVKISGGILKAEEVTRVLQLFPAETSDRFTLHVYTEETLLGPRIAPVLELDAKEGADLDSLAERIAEELRVSPTYTYKDGVTDGRYMPLVCKKLELLASQKKHTRIVKH